METVILLQAPWAVIGVGLTAHWLWRAVGRRRDQRRTEARLREAAHTEAAELDSHSPGHCRYGLRNGAEASAPRRSPGRASGR